jgi:hypothetical protein
MLLFLFKNDVTGNDLHPLRKAKYELKSNNICDAPTYHRYASLGFIQSFMIILRARCSSNEEVSTECKFTFTSMCHLDEKKKKKLEWETDFCKGYLDLNYRRRNIKISKPNSFSVFGTKSKTSAKLRTPSNKETICCRE